MYDLLERGSKLSKLRREIDMELRQIRTSLACLECVGVYECENGAICTIKPLEEIPNLKHLDHGRLISIIGEEKYDLLVSTQHTIKWAEYKNQPMFVKQAISSLCKEMNGGGVSVSFKK